MQYRVLKDTYHNGALCPAGTIVLLDKDPQWPEHFELVISESLAPGNAAAMTDEQILADIEAKLARMEALQTEADAKAAAMVAEAEAKAAEAEVRALRAEAGEKAALAEVEKLKKKAAKA